MEMDRGEHVVICDEAVAAHAGRLVTLAEARGGGRFVLGIAGIGASGKSTLARKVVEAVNALQPGVAFAAAMDGFHLHNAELARLGLRGEKGSPRTFDGAGYAALLTRLRGGAVEPVPVYDRDVHEPVAGGEAGPGVRLIVAEGNYLLLQDEPWAGLSGVLDETWWVQIDPDQARDWMIARHVAGGRSEAEATRHWERNDRPNGELILQRSRAADVTWCWD
jgi:pantothenate kinase